MRVNVALDALNFALAGAREGFGPFLGVFLQARGFDPAATGIAMSLAGASGLVATTPIGALIDRSESKRLGLVIAVAAIAVGAVAIVATRHITVIGAAQLLIGIGDTSIAPLVAAMTLGIVGQKSFANRMSRNEAWNHAGNAANAALAAALGYFFGLGYVALAIVVMALASSATLAGLRPGSIDHVKARSGETDERSTWRALLGQSDLMLLAAVVMLFQAASGAMLPFLAQARTAAGSDPSITTGVMTVVARVVMVGAALLAPRIARWRGYEGVMTFALALVALRAGLAANAASWGSVIAVQVLEGTSMGLSSVAIPALNAEMMAGTGRISAGFGAVLTAFGVGATLSPLIAGLVAQHFGYAGSFYALGAVALVGLAVWIIMRRVLNLRAGPPRRKEAVAGDGSA